MPLRLWTLDLAREQAPTRDHLARYCAESLDAGYDALGLYLEHRFAYPSTPWAHGTAAVTPETISYLRREFPSLRLIPFINLLGHMEGFLYTEEGKTYREELFKGLQACPSHPDIQRFCRTLIDDTLSAFDDELIHLGGDETAQLGACPLCAEKVQNHPGDGKAALYADHFSPLFHYVADKGHRPALWADMLHEHPDAAKALPKNALLFEWQYQKGVTETVRPLLDLGFDVVACPTLHVYNAFWAHLPQSDDNIRTHARECRDLNLAGVCVTTWESALMAPMDSFLPALRAARPILDDPDNAPTLMSAYSGPFADLMGRELNELGGVFSYSNHRNKLKCRLLLYSNPFLAWMHHADELCGPAGTEALRIAELALGSTAEECEKGAAIFVRACVEFVRMAEAARILYREGLAERAVAALAPSRYLFETLEATAKRTHERTGGSLADIERCRRAKEHVEVVIRRIRQYGDRSLGYLPAWEVLTHPKFMPHDQGCWWIVNAWGNQ